MNLKVGVFGASGYVGRELLRLIDGHPALESAFATGSGHLDHEAGLSHQADAYLLALPHGVASRFAEALIGRWPEAVIVDLSGDLRLPTAEAYERWYGAEHAAPALIGCAAYGLTELNREAIASSRLISNPGCYATSLLLPLAPLLRAGLASPDDIIADSKSGATGAGRAAREELLFCEVAEDIRAYAPGRQHRHIGEVEHALEALVGCEISLTFCPHLLPVKRGILSALYLRSEDRAERHVEVLREAYDQEPFVHVVERPPTLSDVTLTNECHISVHSAAPGRLVVFSALDNLVKGAAGQALQNLNVAFGWPEAGGLPAVAA